MYVQNAVATCIHSGYNPCVCTLCVSLLQDTFNNNGVKDSASFQNWWVPEFIFIVRFYFKYSCFNHQSIRTIFNITVYATVSHYSVNISVLWLHFLHPRLVKYGGRQCLQWTFLDYNSWGVITQKSQMFLSCATGSFQTVPLKNEIYLFNIT